MEAKERAWRKPSHQGIGLSNQKIRKEKKRKEKRESETKQAVAVFFFIFCFLVFLNCCCCCSFLKFMAMVILNIQFALDSDDSSL